ncbi:MAG: DUF433 domain-containing protein [Terriglobales bacterium]
MRASPESCSTLRFLLLGAPSITRSGGAEQHNPFQSFTRITVDANQMGGLPCIRSLRIPIAAVVGMVGEGLAEAEILNGYPELEVEDVREALRYAAEAVEVSILWHDVES